jgi:hypothetical protein
MEKRSTRLRAVPPEMVEDTGTDNESGDVRRLNNIPSVLDLSSSLIIVVGSETTRVQWY